jgi:pimeloyl-ACP methyl ester carboxylesterase
VPAAERFVIDIDDRVLTDLRDRLLRTRWPADLANDDWSYGTNRTYLRSLVEHWLNEYDWRQREQAMNRLNHFRTLVDGVPIHFVHERGRGPNPLPLVLTHGWPWTFWDYRDVIGPLTDPAAYGGDPADAFDVVVPSLPGFAFSTPLQRTGIQAWSTADLWVTLMTKVLGYERFAAGGGDWGGLVTGQLAHKYPDRIVGIYVLGRVLAGGLPALDSFSGERPWDPYAAGLETVSGDDRTRYIDWTKRYLSHIAVQSLDPQTLAYAMHDSPVGLCAWLVERRRTWSDCGGDVEARFSKNDLLDSVMLYWATESFPSALRYYAEAIRFRWTPSHAGDRFTVPVGYTAYSHDQPFPIAPGPLPTPPPVCFAMARNRGGHFAPAEEPQAFVDDVRATFRSLR